MLCIYVIVLCNISPKLFFQRKRDREGGGGWESKALPYFSTNFIHQRSRYSAYTLTGRVNKPLDMC